MTWRLVSDGSPLFCSLSRDLRGVSVMLFDPTAQWTGFLRPQKNPKMISLYPAFGLKRTDVRAFPGHIACDGASRSELVTPLTRDGRLIGVLDLDSPDTGRFGPAEQALAEALAALIAGGSDLKP